jgi:diketogulonate reductase-like aldo/keto reductase
MLPPRSMDEIRVNECKPLGASQVSIPAIGWGTWRYKGGIEPLRAGIDRGATLIDTAEVYGTEEVVGQAISGRRDQVFLATKVAPRNFRRDHLIAAAENSLRRLHVDHIDLYQLHWPNYTVPFEETMGAMEDLVKCGKIRFIGVSNFSVWDLQRAQAALSTCRIVSNQVRYSLIERTVERELLDYCAQQNITVIAYSPLGEAFSRLRAADAAGSLGRLAAKAGKSEAQIALNWLIAKPNVVVIPKASSVGHAIEDCGASEWRLAQAEYKLLEESIPCHRRGPIAATLARWKRYVDQCVGRQL